MTSLLLEKLKRSRSSGRFLLLIELDDYSWSLRGRGKAA
jgi:hypothetical protein